MTTVSDLTSALVTQVDAVSGTGSVYGYTRYVADPATYLSLFKQSATEDIRGWWVSLRQPAITSEATEFHNRTRLYHFVITGIMGLRDSLNTEATFIAQAEAILDALDDETTLGVAGVIVAGFDAQCRMIDHRTFHGTLCHYAEIEVNVPVIKSF